MVEAVGTVDVAVVGDGPAGSALAHALTRHGVDVLLLGSDAPWHATYTTWCHDLDGLELLEGADIWSTRLDAVAAHFDRSITIRQPYGVIDNVALRTWLRRGVTHRAATVRSAADLDARLVVDATGWPSGLDDGDKRALVADPDAVAWQTAYGVVLDEPPQGRLGEPTMMDFRQPSTPGDVDVPTFAYAFPVTDGWLVEETVLAGPRIDPEQLVPRLASRLAVSADELASIARRVERVRIPMGAPIPTGAGTPAGTIAAVRFGAAAGMIHTATGYSVAASLRAADRVAGVIATRLGAHAGAASKDDIHEIEAAIWPRSLRRARRLHDYGLDVLLDMDAAEIRTFFETFFALSDERWASYLRIDSSPRELAGTMAAMFRRADWSLRRRLLSGDLRLLLAALRL